LLIVDRMFTPLQYPLIDSKHLIYYDSLNDVKDKIHYFLNNESERKTIANNGCEYAINHHRTVNRIEYILGVINGNGISPESM